MEIFRGGEFVRAIGDLQPADHHQRRMHADNDGDRAFFAPLVIFLHDQTAMLALRHHQRRHLGLMRLHAVGTEIDPAAIRVLHHHHAGRADKGTAVIFVPDRRRDALDIDLVPFLDIFQQRSAINLLRRNAGRAAHIVAPPLDEIHLGRLGRQAKRDIDARHRCQQVRHHAVTLGKAGDIVEQNGRGPHLALDDIDDAADVFLKVGAADGMQLAGRLDCAHPVAQVLVRHD